MTSQGMSGRACPNRSFPIQLTPGAPSPACPIRACLGRFPQELFVLEMACWGPPPAGRPEGWPASPGRACLAPRIRGPAHCAASQVGHQRWPTGERRPPAWAAPVLTCMAAGSRHVCRRAFGPAAAEVRSGRKCSPKLGPLAPASRVCFGAALRGAVLRGGLGGRARSYRPLAAAG